MARNHYHFHLIFKGLFRCVPDRKNNNLSILMVDGRSPKNSPATGEALRDHRAVIEFRLGDWRNRTLEPLRNFIEVNKRNKGKVGIYLLNKQDVQIGVSDGQLSPQLKFIEDNSPTSFLRLPRMEMISPGSEKIRADALELGKNCVARVMDLGHGEVRSERPSTFGGERLRWAFLLARKRDDLRRIFKAGGAEKEAMKRELFRSEEANLDLRISSRVPRGAAVLINPNPFPENGVALDPPAFMLRPEKGQDLEVWVKNRELDVILTESDGPGREEGCLANELVDFDFELQYELSESAPERRIPYRSDAMDDGPVTAGGCACGGCSGGG